MALIKCPECGNEISDRAHACPYCGLPQEDIIELLRETRAEGVEGADAKADAPWDNVPLHVPGMIRCAVCGAAYNSGGVFRCTECGYPRLQLTRDYQSLDALLMADKLLSQIHELSAASSGILREEEYRDALRDMSVDERWRKVALDWESQGNAEKAIECFTVAAKRGNAEAQISLGMIYYDEEKGVARDLEKSKKWLKMAADHGHPDAMNRLGYIYELDEGNVKEAVKWYRRASDLGHAKARNNLGVIYEKGAEGIAPDIAEAKRLYKLSADQGFTGAMRNLGLLYKKENDLEQAKLWCKRAADLGNDEAMNSLGNIYKKEGNPEEAKRWYLLAAEKNNSIAMYNLGYFYYKAGDNEEAKKWYQRAAEQNDSRAMFNLGLLYFREKDNEEAQKWFKRAADLGDIDAMARLGHLLLMKGRTEKAMDWFTRAAEKGNKSAQGSLGLIYDTGDYGIPRNEEEAIKWYTMSAEQGHVPAQLKLGELYRYSEKYDEAIKWFTAAAEKGNADAMVYLGELYESYKKNLDEAVRWYTRASSKGHEIAPYGLGLIYNKGILLPRDRETAKKWFLLGAERGDKNSQNMLGEIYDEEGNTSEAIKYYKAALDNGVMKCLKDLGIMYYKLGCENWWQRKQYFDEAMKYLRSALRYTDFSASEQTEISRHIDAINGNVNLYKKGFFG